MVPDDTVFVDPASGFVFFKLLQGWRFIDKVGAREPFRHGVRGGNPGPPKTGSSTVRPIAVEASGWCRGNSFQEDK